MSELRQLSLLDVQTAGAPYQKDSPTSIAAAVAAGPKVGTQKARILAVIGKAGGWTQDQLSIYLHLPRSTVCARCRELELEGRIRKTARTRTSQYGKACAVYVAVQP